MAFVSNIGHSSAPSIGQSRTEAAPLVLGLSIELKSSLSTLTRPSVCARFATAKTVYIRSGEYHFEDQPSRDRVALTTVLDRPLNVLDLMSGEVFSAGVRS